MPEEDKSTEGVQKEEGKPEAKPQASASKEQADPDGVIELDVTKKYHSKRRPDVAISGDKLMAGYGRGLEYDNLQSKHQKLEAQEKATADKLSAAEERIAQFEANSRLTKAMQNLGIGASGQKPVAKPQAEDWLTPGEEPNGENPFPNVNPAEIASRVDNFEAEMRNRLSPEKQEQILRDEAGRLYAIQQEKRDAEDTRNRAATNIRRAKLAKLKVAYPDIPEDDLEGIANAQNEYMAHVIAAAELSQQGDDQGAIETFLDGEEKLEAMLVQQFGFMTQQKEIASKREQEAELEAFSTGSVAEEEGEEKEEPTYDWHEGEKKRVSRLEKAKQLVTRRQQLKNSGAG